jgi:hypothetical protein
MDNRFHRYMATPLLYGDFLYAVRWNGILGVYVIKGPGLRARRDEPARRAHAGDAGDLGGFGCSSGPRMKSWRSASDARARAKAVTRHPNLVLDAQPAAAVRHWR